MRTKSVPLISPQGDSLPRGEKDISGLGRGIKNPVAERK